jgi:hypothetical protein
MATIVTNSGKIKVNQTANYIIEQFSVYDFVRLDKVVNENDIKYVKGSDGLYNVVYDCSNTEEIYLYKYQVTYIK